MITQLPFFPTFFNPSWYPQHQLQPYHIIIIPSLPPSSVFHTLKKKKKIQQQLSAPIEVPSLLPDLTLIAKSF